MTSSQSNYYNRPPITVAKDENRVIIRASAASNCRRQLAYYAHGYTITNPPDNIAINRMLAGTYLEAVAVDWLRRTGWIAVRSFTDDYPRPPRLRIELTDNIIITGTPDAHGLHPVVTDNQLAVLEIKTRGNAAWAQMEKLGTLGAFPSAIAQLAFYRRGLLTYQSKHGLDIIHPDSTGVLVSMNTDTKDVRLFKASDLNLENTLTDLTAKLTPLASLLLHPSTADDPEQLPPKDYRADSWQCKSCPFFQTCQQTKTDTPEEPSTPNNPKVSKLQALDALHTYEEASSNVVDNKIPEADKKTARETLLQYVKGEQVENVELIGRSGLSKNIKITKRETTQVDLEALGQLLSTEQYNNIVKLKVTESVSVR